MSEMDLTLRMRAIFPDKAILDQVSTALAGFQQGQLTRNTALINHNRTIIQQMVQMGQIGRTQLTQMNQAIGSGAVGGTPFAAVTRGANAAAAAVGGIGVQGKFSLRVLEAFFLYRGFVFLQQGILNTTRALIDLEHQVSLIMTQLPNFGVGQRGFITQGIIDVARDTGQSFADVASAEYQIVSAGVDAAQSLEVLHLSAKAAAAGGSDIETAFNGALSQINAFGLGMGDLNRVYDMQFQLVRRGIFNYQQLGTIIGITSTAFEQAGQSIETQNAALAAMSEVFTGPQLARGATALRSFVLAMSTEPEKFAKLGIATRTANGDVRDLIPVVRELAEKLNALPTGERADIIKDILPDIRQQAGVIALTQNVDSLTRNYIEQKLALGDLNKAYATVEKDAKLQIQTLKDSVMQGFRPLGDAVGSVVGGLNQMEKILPGVTSLIVELTAATIALSLAQAAMSRSQLVGLAAFGKSGSLLRYGVPAIGGLATIGTAYAAGRQPGAGSGTIFGAGVGGFASGALFGAMVAPGPLKPPAAIIGGIISAATAAIAAAVGESARESATLTGETLAEAFARELKEDQTVGQSIANAFKASVAEAPPPTQDAFERAARGEFILETGGERRRFKTIRAAEEAGYEVAARTTGGDVLGIKPELVSNQLKTYAEDAFRLAQSKIEAARKTPEFLGGTQSQQDTLIAGIQVGTVADKFAADEVIGRLVLTMIRASDTVEEFRTAFSLVSDPVKFYDFIGALLAGREGALAAASAFDEFANVAQGDFTKAADVFSNLGDEGKRLAEVFQDMSNIMSGFQALEALNKLTVQRQVVKYGATPQEAEAMLAKVLPQAQLDLMRGAISQQTFESIIQRAIPSDVTSTENRGVLSLLGVDSDAIALEMTAQLRRKIEEIKTQQGGTLQDALVKFLMGGGRAPATVAAIELGANSLEQALMDASVAVREGLVDGMGYTADQLEMLGEEFRDLNVAVAKVGLLKELGGIGEFLGLKPGFLDPAIQQIYEAAKVGGQSLVSLLQDPNKLVDLLAEIKFGDVQVDNSTNQNIVVRIEGNLDTAGAAAAADTIIAKLNEAARQKVRR